MSYRIIFSAPAQKDLQEIYDWYEEQQPGVGEKFLEAIDKSLEKTATTPTASPVKYDNIRCKLIKRFPYLVHYSVNDTDQIITVFRIFHTSRMPFWDV